MTRIRKRLPSPAMIVAVIALVLAVTGTSYAAFGLGILKNGAKTKVVGVGPLTYVSSTASVGPTGPGGLTVAAICPPGTFPIGGGIRVLNDVIGLVNDSHPISGGWGGTVFNNGTAAFSAVTTVACATSRFTTGTLQTTS